MCQLNRIDSDDSVTELLPASHFPPKGPFVVDSGWRKANRLVEMVDEARCGKHSPRVLSPTTGRTRGWASIDIFI